MWAGRDVTAVMRVIRASSWSRPLRCCRHFHLASSKLQNTRGQPRWPSRAQRPKQKSRPVNPVPDSSSNPVRQPDYDTADAIFKSRRLPLLAAGVVALVSGLYCTMMVSSFLQTSQAPDTADPTGRPPGFTRESAERFDRSLDASEKRMGITSLRKRLGERASGHVLEVAIGTGRNMTFYDWSAVVNSPPPRDTKFSPRKISNQTPMVSFTGIDVSSDMLSVAMEKLPKVVPSFDGVATAVSTSMLPSSHSRWAVCSYLGGRVRIAQGDIQQNLLPPEPTCTTGSKYDTVVQTFGLCSVKDPERVVLNLASAVRPGTGRIILIEHGQSWWGIVNTLLDWSAPSHFYKYGCWWNRDIISIVENAARAHSGLRILSIERPFLTQLGTTVWIELQVDQQVPADRLPLTS